MQWLTLNEQTRKFEVVTDSFTIEKALNCLGVALTMWLSSGENIPNAEATDGISEEEDALGEIYEWSSSGHHQFVVE